jgi:putative heme-binding domain-containing protein
MGRGLKQSGSRLESTSLAQKAAVNFLRNSLRSAISTARDETAESELRRQAIELLSLASYTDTRETLAELLDPRQPAVVQIAAIQALRDYPDVEIGKLLLERWSSYAPDVRGAATAALLARGERTRQLLEAALSGHISLAHLDTTQRSFLTEHPDAAIQTLAKKAFADATHSRDEVLRFYANELDAAADARRGEAVFRRECMICHKINDIGHAVGPDLTSSTYRERDTLLVHVLDPNRNVLPKYESYVCIDNDGRVTTGILTSQTATSITLQRQDNEVSTILRTNIDSLTSTGKSLMPERFEENISRQEMADLLAFLQSSQVSEAAGPLDVGTLPGMVEPDSSAAK